MFVNKAEKTDRELLQLGQNSVGTRDIDTALSLLCGVNHLAVVDGDGIPGSSVAHGPANSLAEGKLGIRGEDLWLIPPVLANLSHLEKKKNQAGWKKGEETARSNREEDAVNEG